MFEVRFSIPRDSLFNFNKSCGDITVLTDKTKSDLIDIKRYKAPWVTEVAQGMPNAFSLFILWKAEKCPHMPNSKKAGRKQAEYLN